MSHQDEIFRNGEGDSWFARNASVLKPGERDDVALRMIEANSSTLGPLESVCEAGCANGWRLGALRERSPSPSRLVGFDASAAAIEAGKLAWPSLDLHVALLDEPPPIGTFDLVIVNFVFSWVDRSRLAQVVASIDSLVGPHGALLIADFLPDSPCRRRYHHRDDIDLYTYKQNYAEPFLALQTYELLDKTVFVHAAAHVDPTNVDEQDRAAGFLLRKSHARYRTL